MRFLILAMLALYTTPILATSSIWQSVGDWSVYKTEEGCGFEKVEHQGATPSTLAVLRFVSGRNALELRNVGWSIKKGDVRQLLLLFDDSVYEGPAMSPLDGTIILTMTKPMLTSLSAANSLTAFLKISDEHEIPLEQFSLAKSKIALDSSDRCLENVVAARRDEQLEAERLARRQRRVPSDPFSAVTNPDFP